MITLQQAIAAVHSQAYPLGAELRELDDINGCALARAVAARFDVPRFTSSAMDGYAVRSTDIADASEMNPVRLHVTHEIPAGAATQERVGACCAARIFTGAMLALGADAVLMQEHVSAAGDEVIITSSAKSGQHIRHAGEEFKKGTVVLDAGTIITPAVIGLLASLGYARAPVHRTPRVVLIVTGDELQPPGETLKAGQIHDSNSYALHAALRSMGVEAVRYRVRDDHAALKDAVRSALQESDIVITSGGISEGDHDHVRSVMHALRVREQFWRVAMKPGKPVYFGTRGKQLLFGLPGNPVSALLATYLFVRPAIAIMRGLPLPPLRSIAARLGITLKKKPGREEFIRVVVHADGGDATALLAVGQGSHMMGGLACSDGVIRFAATGSVMMEGTHVNVERIEWSLS